MFISQIILYFRFDAMQKKFPRSIKAASEMGQGFLKPIFLVSLYIEFLV